MKLLGSNTSPYVRKVRVVMVEKTLGSFTVPTVLNQMKFGTKYDGTTASSFELVSFKHIMSTE